MVCPGKLTSPSSVHVHIMSDFFQCIFFRFCSFPSLFPFSVLSVVNARIIFVTLICLFHLNLSVHSLLRHETGVKFKNYLHVHVNVHLVESGGVKSSVHLVLFPGFLQRSTFSNRYTNYSKA